MSGIKARLLAERDELTRKLAECEADLADVEDRPTGGPEPVILADFLSENLGEQRWLIEGLMPVGSVTNLVAFGGVGKTTMITNVALCLAAGRNVEAINARVTSPISVLYVSAEGSRVLFRERLETARQNLKIAKSPTQWFIQPKELTDYLIGSAGLERMIVKSSARLVILDTLGYFWKGDRNSDGEWKERVMAPLRALTARTDAAFLLVHHLTKGDDWKGRGTGAMFDDCDLHLHLEDPSGGTFEGPDMPVRLWVRKNKNGVDHFYFPLVYRKHLAIFEKEGLPLGLA